MFIREPRLEPHGTVAMFKDLYSNLWDLLEPRATLLAAAKLARNPARAPTTIENGVNDRRVVLNFVIDGVRETLRQHSMVATGDSVNSGVEFKRINVGDE